MTARTALRPWIIVAVALPVLAAVAYAAGLFDAPPPPPIADPNVRDLERSLTPPPVEYQPRHPGRAPLVIFLGDSRYRKLLFESGYRLFARRPHPLTIDGVTLEVLTFFTQAGATVADLDRFVKDILAWEPDALVVQPELLVEETSFRGLAPAANVERRRLENWEIRLDLWAEKAELPKAGRALPAGRELLERARRAGIRVLVAQIPPSEAVAKVVPKGYYETMRALVCTILVSCERDYLTFAASYPDDYFSDPLHLSTQGRKVVYPLLMKAVAKALGVSPTSPR